MSNEYLLISSKIAPEAFMKVLQVKKMLSEGKSTKINDAIAATGISRSTFYKYKDYVFEYNKKGVERVFTFFFDLADVSGVLSEILKIFAQGGFNVLTINQNIPVNGYANVTITARYGGEDVSFEELAAEIRQLNGVNKVQLLAVQ